MGVRKPHSDSPFTHSVKINASGSGCRYICSYWNAVYYRDLERRKNYFAKLDLVKQKLLSYNQIINDDSLSPDEKKRILIFM